MEVPVNEPRRDCLALGIVHSGSWTPVLAKKVVAASGEDPAVRDDDCAGGGLSCIEGVHPGIDDDRVRGFDVIGHETSRDLEWSSGCSTPGVGNVRRRTSGTGGF